MVPWFCEVATEQIQAGNDLDAVKMQPNRIQVAMDMLDGPPLIV
jgi:hypothetical protein